MKCRYGLLFVFVLVCVVVQTVEGALPAPSRAQVGVPDPSRSGCEFPSLLPCPGPFSILVTLRDAFDSPVGACSTGATIVVDSGGLGPNQATFASGFTDGAGTLKLAFPTIFGAGTIHFEVEAFCVGTIAICSSPTYTLLCTDPTPVAAVTWGRLKTLYR